MSLHTAPTSRSTRPDTTTSQSLRPRNRRLISGLSDDEHDDVDLGAVSGVGSSSARLASPRATPLGSPGRSVSPIPSPHPSRSNSRRGTGSGRFAADGLQSAGTSGTGGNFNAIWGSSWSALQGLASNVLGSEVQDGSVANNGKARLRRPLELTHGKRRSAGSAPPAQWGPSGQGVLDIGGGSTEEREAAVRARKRKDMLKSGAYNAPDVNGRFKRRMSDDRTTLAGSAGAVRPAEEDMEGDALVYVHEIKLHDTLSGLAIRYNCPAQILRKANRMWAHDSVQTRKMVVLPVDACGVKGKPVSGPLVEGTEEEDLMQFRDLTPRKEKDNPIDELPNGWHPRDRHAADSQLRPTGDGNAATSTAASSTGGDLELPWKHDSWVLLPNETAPTEIARLPRRALGYFPPARRKSISYSDGGGERNSPSVSFDIPRQSSSPLATSTIDHTIDPATKAALDRVRISSGTRSARSSSMASSTAGPNSTNPPKWLLGPGGVGTLDRTTRTPGPAQDSFNRILGPHLPDVRPPPGTTFLPPPAFPSILDEDFESGASAFRTGAYGRYAGAGGDAGMDFARGLSGVETWVRRMATRSFAAAVGDGSSSAGGRSSSRSRTAISVGGGAGGTSSSHPAGVVPLTAGGGVGDLIELMEPLDIGSDDHDHSNDGFTETRTGPEVRVDAPEDGTWRIAGGSARPDLPLGMSRRAGRSADRKSGKGD